MNKRKTLLKLILFSFCFSLFFNSTAHGKVTTIDTLNLEITLPDQVIFLPSDTPSNDPLWGQVGISDVSSEKEALSDMGGKGIFYDQETETLVRLLSKTSNESQDMFNLNQRSQEERQIFYATLMDTTDDSTTITVEEYPQSEIPFFRMSIHTEHNGIFKEIIYGTIVNGTMIYFDVFTEGNNEIDESFLQTLVAGTHITQQYTVEEYNDLRKQSMINLALLLLSILAVILALVLILRKRKKVKTLKQQMQKDALYQYYASKKEREALGIKQTQLFENQTTYSEDIIRQFCNYNFFQKKIITWAITGVSCVIAIVSLYNQSGLNYLLLILIALIIAVIVAQFLRIDKLCNNLWKPYASSKSKVAIFKFYEDHFTMTGIQSYMEYPYVQLTSVRVHNGFIYLYLDSERAFYLSKDGFTTNPDELINFIKDYLKTKNKMI